MEFEKLAFLCHCHYFDANTLKSGNNTIDFMHLSEEGHYELAQALHQIILQIFNIKNQIKK